MTARQESGDLHRYGNSDEGRLFSENEFYQNKVASLRSDALSFLQQHSEGEPMPFAQLLVNGVTNVTLAGIKDDHYQHLPMKNKYSVEGHLVYDDRDDAILSVSALTFRKNVTKWATIELSETDNPETLVFTHTPAFNKRLREDKVCIRTREEKENGEVEYTEREPSIHELDTWHMKLHNMEIAGNSTSNAIYS